MGKWKVVAERVALLPFCLVLAGCGMFSGDAVQELEVLDVGGHVVGEVVVGETLWLVVDTDPLDFAPDDSDLMAFDTATGTEVSRARLPFSPTAFMSSYDGDLWFTTRQMVEGVDLRPETDQPDNNSASLVRFDVETNSVDYQILLDSVNPWGLVFYEETAWTVTSFLRSVHLSTGEVGRGFGASPYLADQLESLDGSLWWADDGNITKVDPASGDWLFQVPLQDGTELGDTRLKRHEGKFWVSGASQGEPGSAFVLDPGTGELDGPLVGENLPTRSFESDTIRWELFNSRWDASSLEPAREQDVWRRVDVESGDVLGEYRFEEYVPIAELNGSLWLRGPEGLGRVAVEDLADS